MTRPRFRAPAALAGLLALTSSGNADVLYRGGVDSTPGTVLEIDGTYGGRSVGDDYNTGYVSINITGFRFYGGLVRPNDSLFIDFYDLNDTRIGTISPFSEDVTGLGVHSLRPETFGEGNASFLPGVGSVLFAPFKFNEPLDPTNPPKMQLGYGSAPSVGGNDPLLSTQGFDDAPNIRRASYAPGVQQYAQVEIIGTGNNAAWSNAGSGAWTDSASWTMAVPNAVNAAASFLRGIGADATVTLPTTQTVGFLAFDNANRYTLAGPGTLKLTGRNGFAAARVYVNSGSHSITAPFQYTSGAIFTTYGDPVGGAPSLTLPLNTTAAGTLTKNGAGTLAFAASAGGIATLSLPSITINGGTIALKSNATHANRTVLKTTTLTMNGGTLDLGANDLVLVGAGSTGTAAVRLLLQQGYANGTWSGLGLTSSAAAASTTPKGALGYLLNTNGTGGTLYPTFDGLTVTAADVLVKYTVLGDSNIDGSVNFDDLLALAQNYGSETAVWNSGDFNYDGLTDFSDLLALAQNYGTQLLLNSSESITRAAAGGNGFAADWNLVVALVPEPSTVAALAAFGVATFRRRR